MQICHYLEYVFISNVWLLPWKHSTFETASSYILHYITFILMPVIIVFVNKDFIPWWWMLCWECGLMFSSKMIDMENYMSKRFITSEFNLKGFSRLLEV